MNPRRNQGDEEKHLVYKAYKESMDRYATYSFLLSLVYGMVIALSLVWGSIYASLLFVNFLVLLGAISRNSCRLIRILIVGVILLAAYLFMDKIKAPLDKHLEARKRSILRELSESLGYELCEHELVAQLEGELDEQLGANIEE